MSLGTFLPVSFVGLDFESLFVLLADVYFEATRLGYRINVHDHTFERTVEVLSLSDGVS